MEYLDQARRERLVRARNHLGETPLHLAVAFAGPALKSKQVGTAVQVGVQVKTLHNIPCVLCAK